MRLSLARLAALGVFLAGCSAPPAGPMPTPEALTDAPVELPTADVAALVQGSNRFSLDLLRRIDPGKNAFASPFSVGVAVSLAFAHNADDAVGRALHVPFDQARLNAAYAALLGTVRGDGGKPRPYELALANAVWLTTNKEFKPFPEYVAKAKEFYAAPPRGVDFLGDGVKQINTWCAEQTRDKVKKILEPVDVGGSTAAVLTNAIYFKGDWKSQFKKDRTQEDGLFHVAADKTVKAPLMNQLVTAGYHRADEAQVLELPYKGDELAMLVVLPNRRDGLAAVEKDLTGEKLAAWAKQLKKGPVRVTLPRFTIAGGAVPLKATLDKMGWPVGGSPHIGTPPPGTVLYVDEVFHRGYVEVNEAGAEAAAVTAVVVNFKDQGGREDVTPVFRADHPFLFLIRDNRTGLVLFAGRLVAPV